MVLVCNNNKCKYRTSAGFCAEDLVPLNQFGACGHWWTKEGQFRGALFDYADPEPKEEVKQESPQVEKIEPEDKTEQKEDKVEDKNMPEVKMGD